MCNGTESSISQCSYNHHISPECYVGSHSAAVACREGKTVGNVCPLKLLYLVCTEEIM